MKNHLKILIIGLTSIILSSCININPTPKQIEFEEENIKLYSLVDAKEGDLLSTHFLKEEKIVHVKGEDYMPYIDLQSFVDLYSSVMLDNYKSELTKWSNSEQWYLYSETQQGQAGIFLVTFNYGIKHISYSGDPSSAMRTMTDYSKSSMYIGGTISATVVKAPEINSVTLDYSESEYTTYTKNGETYYPLSLLNTFMTSFSGFSIFYSYKSLYLYNNESDISLWKMTYRLDNNETTSPKMEMKDVVDNTLKKKMPLYLREERLHNIYFTFDNIYGLKSTRNIPSMKEYIISKGYDKGMLSEDNNTRNEATHKFFAELSDGHTRLMENESMKDVWGNANDNYPLFSELWINRMNLRSSLMAQREELYASHEKEVGDVLYSQDESTAFISFDGFTALMDSYDNDGNIKPEIYKEDTFFFLARALEEVKTSGKDVKNVILDIACNGGGYLGIMLKLVTLLSSQNKGHIYLYREEYEALIRQSAVVDSNLDGKMNADDVYGDDFKFYILHSEFSFSCGNAFPFFLEKNKFATMIGHTSGGGECSVVPNVLPTGEWYRHSSPMHMVWPNLDSFIGDEAGVTPTKEIDYKDYYNLEKLVTAISEI